MGSSVTEWTWAMNATQRAFDNLLWANAFTNDISLALWLLIPLMDYNFISHRLNKNKNYSLCMPYRDSIIRLSIVDVTVISDIASVVGLWYANYVYVYSYICMHSWSGLVFISSHPAVQAMWYIMYRIRQSLSYLYNLASISGQLSERANYRINHLIIILRKYPGLDYKS